MKKYFILAAAALAFAACTNDEILPQAEVQQTVDDGSIQFDAYLNRGTTRAGAPGTLTTAGTSSNTKNVSLQTAGFGVLAYYNNGEPYSENSRPDFMYNQKVTYTAPSWKYNPVKYWPNEFGSEAVSEGTDRLTFFAYAPYVNVNLTTGLAEAEAGSGEEATTGIIGLTRNTTHGDPFVKYYADFNPEKRVDLCWGVAKSDFSNSVDGSNNNVKAGKPYIDVVKPTVADKINFDFKHALAALNVTIDADIDLAAHGETAYLDNFTKIWVRSVTFEGFTDKGMLNLNGSATSANYTPEWYDLSGNNKIGSGGKTTIHDGRRDGSEPLGEASNESPAALNPQIVQSYIYNVASAYETSLTTTTALTGVPSGQGINLFNSTTASEPIYVIPTNDDLKITIVYDVETSDKNLTNYLSDGAVKGSTVENKITKEIKISGSSIKLQAGKHYTVALHLGMTSVKFDASVTEWEEGTADPTWLPVNATAYVAGGSYSFDVPAAPVTNEKFAVSGLTGTAVAATAASNTVIATSPAIAASDIESESSVITYSTNENTTVNAREETITVTETGGGETSTTITVKQAAAPLGLTNSGINAAGKVITLGSTGTLAANADWADDAKSHWTVVKKSYDGTTKTLTKVASATAANQYQVAGTATNAATITLYDEAVAGDVYTITVQTGDAAAETTVVKVGGILFPAPVPAVAKTANVTNKVILIGTGNVGYISGTTANATVGSTDGKVVGVAVGTSAITATLTSGVDDGYSYTTNSKTANYTINVTDIAVGGTYNIANTAATDATFKVCGLTHGTGTTITTADSWLSGLSMTAPDANGISTVTYTAAANAPTPAAERTATVLINGREIYIKQAANPLP